MSDVTFVMLLPVRSGGTSDELASAANSPAHSATCGHDRASHRWVTPFPLHTCCHQTLRADAVLMLTGAACAHRYAELKLRIPADAHTLGELSRPRAAASVLLPSRQGASQARALH